MQRSTYIHTNIHAQGTKPWIALGMVIIVPYDLSLKMTGTGHESKWWPAADLHVEAVSRPQTFAGVHYPIILRAAGMPVHVWLCVRMHMCRNVRKCTHIGVHYPIIL
jgi:hypothetical protein